ncbi:MAG: hypothetical protein JJV93_00490 [Alphaproteobacteria bacterium]|nr:hypothetical protein [Alphaproteobacteria bacterium]MBL0717731.1 hypothetical protein [Alphaproteobacteria bacterium]
MNTPVKKTTNTKKPLTEKNRPKKTMSKKDIVKKPTANENSNYVSDLVNKINITLETIMKSSSPSKNNKKSSLPTIKEFKDTMCAVLSKVMQDSSQFTSKTTPKKKAVAKKTTVSKKAVTSKKKPVAKKATQAKK